MLPLLHGGGRSSSRCAPPPWLCLCRRDLCRRRSWRGICRRQRRPGRGLHRWRGFPCSCCSCSRRSAMVAAALRALFRAAAEAGPVCQAARRGGSGADGAGVAVGQAAAGGASQQQSTHGRRRRRCSRGAGAPSRAEVAGGGARQPGEVLHLVQVQAPLAAAQGGALRRGRAAGRVLAELEAAVPGELSCTGRLGRPWAGDCVQGTHRAGCPGTTQRWQICRQDGSVSRVQGVEPVGRGEMRRAPPGWGWWGGCETAPWRPAAPICERQ